MRRFTIYGLDRHGVVAFTRIEEHSTAMGAKPTATLLLARYPKMEVWEGIVLVFRSGGRKA